LNLYAIVQEEIETGDRNIIWEMDRNLMYISYSPVLDLYMGSYPDGDISRIVAIDYKTAEVFELSENGVDERHPSTSDVDDWIYFSRQDNNSKNIYRRKFDSDIEEPVYIDDDYNLTTFNVSSDGKFLLTPKFMNGKGYIVFYDINRHEIIHELNLPIDGHPLYAALSKDNKALFFVNGTPFNFSEPRNIYRMALDRTQLLKLTNFEEKLAFRPLVK
jgi:hypothetical protein